MTRRLDEIGHPLGDEFSCKMAALRLVDDTVDAMRVESTGHAARTAVASGRANGAVGQVFEVELVVDLAELRRTKKAGDEVRS